MFVFALILLFPLALCYNPTANAMFEAILGSGAETLETVTELFESSFPDGRCLMDYDIVCKTRKPEVFDYLMTMLIKRPGPGPGHALIDLLGNILPFMAQNFIFGDEKHQMLLLCLKWWRFHDSQVKRVPLGIEWNVQAGNVEVVKGLFDAGWSCSTSCLTYDKPIKANQAEMIEFFLERNHTLENFGPTVAEMIVSSTLTPVLMEKYLANGLPLNSEQRNHFTMKPGDRVILQWGIYQTLRNHEEYRLNYFELSLRHGNMPLAKMMYSLGLRMRPTIMTNAGLLQFAIMPVQFARYLARKKNFDKIKVVLAGADDQGSEIDGLPVDIVMRVIAGKLDENVDDHEIKPALIEMVSR